MRVVRGVPAAVVVAVVAGLVAALPARAQMDMSDARSMSGIPLPVADLPAGTVVVRLVRGQLANVVPGNDVELSVGGQVRSLKTDASGRASFEGVPAGQRVKATAHVGAEHIESQEFQIPDTGGVRLLLVAAPAAGSPGAAAAAPVPGTVAFGGDTRFIVEFDDDVMEVFYLLDVVNMTGAPVNPPSPLVMEMPPEARGTALLEESSPQASLDGRRVTIAGPFKPGLTQVQVAYRMPTAKGGMTLAQSLPARLERLALIVQQPGHVTVASPQVSQQQEMTSEGRRFIMASGPGLAHGTPLSISLNGAPYRSHAPRYITLAFGLAVLVIGGFAAVRRGRTGEGSARQALQARRDHVFADLLVLEERARDGEVDRAQYERRRHELTARLEQIYGELDTGSGDALDPDRDRDRGRPA